MNALENFTFWLPGELKYAELKGGQQVGYERVSYNDRIKRARMGDGDGSMHMFLGTAWHQAQLLTKQGKHPSNEHEKTAQLQYTKFAAGLFDKYATAMWGRAKLPANAETYSNVAANASFVIVNRLAPWDNKVDGFDPQKELLKPFDESIFSADILDLQIEFVDAVDFDGDTVERAKKFDNVSARSLSLGGMAAQCYLAYAAYNLTPDQLILALSILAD